MSMRVLLKTLNHLTIFKLLNSILLFKLLQYLQFSVLLWCIECHLNCLHVINSDEPEANCFGFSVMQCLATTNAALYGCSVVLWNTAWRKIHRRSVKLFTNRGQASIWPLQGMRLLEPMLLDLVSCEARYELLKSSKSHLKDCYICLRCFGIFLQEAYLRQKQNKKNNCLHLSDALSKANFVYSKLSLSIANSGYTFFVSMCVPWESNPQTFALLTQCSNHWATGTLYIYIYIYETYAFFMVTTVVTWHFSQRLSRS